MRTSAPGEAPARRGTCDSPSRGKSATDPLSVEHEAIGGKAAQHQRQLSDQQPIAHAHVIAPRLLFMGQAGFQRVLASIETLSLRQDVPDMYLISGGLKVN